MTKHTSKQRRGRTEKDENTPTEVLKLQPHRECDDDTPPHKKLEVHVQNLRKRYGPPQSGFPRYFEFDKLQLEIQDVARTRNIKKVGFGHMYGVIQHIDGRYPNTGLGVFVDILLKKIDALQRPPSTRLKQEIEKASPEDKAKLEQVQGWLRARQVFSDPKTCEWKKLYPTIIKLAAEPVKRLLESCRPKEMSVIDFSLCKATLQGFISFAVFCDLQREHFLWLLESEGQILPTVQWLLTFQHEQWDKKLRRILHGSAVSPALFSDHARKMKAAERQRKSRERRNSKKLRQKA
jgi:hypothetical protein